MSHRILCTLLVGIAGGMTSAAYALIAGWGFVVAFVAYSICGALCLVAAAMVAAAVDMHLDRRQPRRAGAGYACSSFARSATAHNG